LPRTRFFSNAVPDARVDRSIWQEQLLAAAVDLDWVFLDPDNGIEIASPGQPMAQYPVTGRAFPVPMASQIEQHPFLTRVQSVNHGCDLASATTAAQKGSP
jgi:hypothetical protein